VFSLSLRKSICPALCPGRRPINIDLNHTQSVKAVTTSRSQMAKYGIQGCMAKNEKRRPFDKQFTRVAAPCLDSRLQFVHRLWVTSASPFDQHAYHCPQAHHIAPFAVAGHDPDLGHPPNFKIHQLLKAECKLRNESDIRKVINNVSGRRAGQYIRVYCEHACKIQLLLFLGIVYL